MKSKHLMIIIIVLIVIVVGLVSYIMLNSENSKIPLSYTGSLMDITGSSGDWSQISHNYGVNLSFNTTGVLYNGQVTLSYLAMNGSWVQLPTRQLGTIDSYAGDTGFMFMTQNCQYVAGTKYATPFYFNSNNNLIIIRIDAFGFTKPQ